jgi:hypothetical protein
MSDSVITSLAGATAKAGTLQRKRTGTSPASGAAPPIVQEVLRSPGQRLDPVARAFFEPRFGCDLDRVRVYTDARAVESARSVNADAYTAGPNIVFSLGRYAPGTTAGRKLLAHELAHVLQQDPDSVRRQSSGQTTPAFSVDQASYLQKVDQALQGMTGNLVHSNTLAPVMEPALRFLSQHVTWRDESGKYHGGSPVSIRLPGDAAASLNLRLVLDDDPTPHDRGEFRSTSNTDGEIIVNIRMTPDVDSLQHVLFHEGSHMMVWAIKNAGATRFANQDRKSVRALNLSIHAREIASIRNQLAALATGVNNRRSAAKQPPVTGAQLDQTASFLMNEAVVRAETKVFELYADTEKMLATPGPKIFVDTSQELDINFSMVDRYVFDFSKTFLPSDRGGLTAGDQQVLNLLRDMLIGIASLQVARQFSVTPYTMGQGIPRAPLDLPLQPLQPPQFRPLPLP